MKQVKSLMKKIFHPLLILCMVLIIIAGIIIIINSRQNYTTEEWVYEYLETYGNGLTELDLEVLTKELSLEIDQRIKEINGEPELSQDQLIALMAVIDDKLQYTAHNSSQEEISALTAGIVKKLISENMPDSYAASQKTAESIDELERELIIIKRTIKELESGQENIYQERQIKEIAQNTNVDESSVRKWIEEMQPDYDLSAYDSAIKKLAELLDVDASTLEKLVKQASDTSDSFEYMISRLGTTEEKLTNALQQLGDTDSRELTELLAKLNTAEKDLQNQITNNMSLTVNSLTSVQNQVSSNKNTTDAAIASNKADTDRQISENKKYTDSAIEELQSNVLFYSYDPDSNTLELFEKPEGGEP